MTAASLPSFSIVIPTYQRRELVCEAVATLAGLDYEGAIELIVVVDGSTDGTADALRAVGLPFRVHVIEQANGGLANARNNGAALATHDIVLFLDDDMFCAPDLLERHAQTYAEGADAVVGEIPLEPNSPKGFLTEGISLWADRAAQDARTRLRLSPFNIFGGQISLRRSVFEDLGGFEESYTAQGGYGKEDADLAVRLLDRYDVRHNPDAVTWHRYVVDPREYLRRGYQLGVADVRFALAHPRFAHDIFAIFKADHPINALVLRPLARVPLVPWLLVGLGSLAATALLRSPLRSSRTFARAFHAVRMVNYWKGVADAGGMPRTRRALVLCYHAIADHSDDPVLHDYSIPRARFEAHLASLQRRGFHFITASQLLDMLRHGTPLSRKAVLLTFDDCYEDLLPLARELLGARGIPALAFAVTRMASGTNEWDQPAGAHRLRLLDREELRQLPCHGVTVASHSCHHYRMPQLDAATLAAEAANSASDIASLGCLGPSLFAYPFGETDHRCRAAVREAGYQAAFGLADKAVTPENDLFDLPRMSVVASDGPFRFWLKTTFPRVSTVLRWRQYRANWRALVRRRLDRHRLRRAVS